MGDTVVMRGAWSSLGVPSQENPELLAIDVSPVAKVVISRLDYKASDSGLDFWLCHS